MVSDDDPQTVPVEAGSEKRIGGGDVIGVEEGVLQVKSFQYVTHAEAGGLGMGLELLEQQLLNMLEMTSYVYVQNSVVYMYIYTNKFMYINMY